MNKYESVLIMKPNLTEKEKLDELDNYKKMFESFSNKKVVRYIGEDENILETPIEEEITIENLPEIKDIISIEVDTKIKPNKTEAIE